MRRKKIPFPTVGEGVGDQVINLLIEANKKGIDVESAVRLALKKYEKALLQKA